MRSRFTVPIVDVMHPSAISPHTYSSTHSIIPSPGILPGPVNMTAVEYINGTWTLAAGSYRYANTLPQLFLDSGSPYNTLVNEGTIWSDIGTQRLTYDISLVGALVNRGKIVIIADEYPRYDYFNRQDVNGFLHSSSVVNSGEIFAITTNGDARVFDFRSVIDLSGQIPFSNTGLLAARADNGRAEAIFLRYGGDITNGAGGRILAEGLTATAILYKGGGGTIQNAGLIQAASLNPEVASIALRLGHTEFNVINVNNSGVIKADYAIYADDYSAVTATQRGVENITNHAGGLIEGIIDLSRGNDTIENRGTIRGEVVLGEGNDRFDTRGGTFVGAADLGWGEDLFLGSEGGDRVAGDNGDDRIEGNGGNDLLFGGGNNDLLIGGEGNDGLYGEYGDDRIVTARGDVAEGGAGNDRIESGDYAFARIDGGAGYDQWVLPNGARALDLSQVVASGRVLDIEAVVLAGSQTLVVRAGDVAALSGGQALRVNGGASDLLYLAGSWTSSGTVSENGITYVRFMSGSSVVLVQSGMQVGSGAQPPTAAGLDAVAAGDAAPAPGSGGLDWTPIDFFLVDHELTQSVTVNPEEIWWNDGLEPVLTDNNSIEVILTNHGEIGSYSDYLYPFTRTIEAHRLEQIVNYGLISALSIGGTGLNDFTETIVRANRVTNAGLIEAQALQGTAIALSLGVQSALSNTGEIFALSETGAAIGISDPGTLTNTGVITAIGGQSAIGAILSRSGLANDGVIEAVTTATGAHRSVGVSLQLGFYSGAASFTNSGTIIADIAVQYLQDQYNRGASVTLTNTGLLEGAVALGSLDDTVINRGAITGITTLGEGNDLFDGSGGTQAAIQGGAGNDRLLGGANDDWLDGGAGADVLHGGAGDDRIVYDSADDMRQVSGGAGNDVLVIDGAVPTGIDLNSQGFEAAEVTQRGQGGNVDSVVSTFNGSWQVVQTTTNHLDGSRVTVNADPTNAYDTRQVWNSYDAQGRLSSVDNVYDNGTRLFINLDEDGSKAWRQDWFAYDAQGRLDSEDVLYDAGSRTFVNFDQADQFGWAQDWFNYDALGRFDSEDVVRDDGSHIFIDLDQGNGGSWASAWFSYDAQGRLDTQDVINDDGSRTFTNYDQAGSEAFQLTAMVYDASGRLDHQVIVWDDGSKSYIFP